MHRKLNATGVFLICMCVYVCVFGFVNAQKMSQFMANYLTFSYVQRNDANAFVAVLISADRSHRARLSFILCTVYGINDFLPLKWEEPNN